jgi:hypothetical protein
MGVPTESLPLHDKAPSVNLHVSRDHRSVTQTTCYAPRVFERLFHLSVANTTVRTEIIAGITTFLTMAYIIFVQPAVLSAARMEFGAVLLATCLASAAATVMMGRLSMIRELTIGRGTSGQPGRARASWRTDTAERPYNPETICNIRIISQS